ncbi:AAA family ATPase [Azohydromonas sediminis]|uniref:AAA family ATPase n=1 Tax=Azohydromonas sediminis TaxID=2259674 RepID=UPI0013C2F375|nr:AAA family ATPase [Azohydromonas sediminis]
MSTRHISSCSENARGQASPRRADPDLARQLRWIEQFSASVMPAPVLPPQKATPQRRLFDEDRLDEQIEWASRLTGEAREMTLQRLTRARQLGSQRVVATVPAPEVLADLDRRFPNFAEVTELVRMHLSLCRLAVEPVLRLPPLLLDGPPGIGKTVFARQLCAALGVPLIPLSVSTLSADFSLAGLDASYASAKPGVVWDALDQPCMSPMVLLDELDKLPSRADSGLGCLYALLERHSAKEFIDEALRLPIDASHLLWIATCNDADAVEPALRSRFQHVRVKEPTREQLWAVIQSVHEGLRRESEWAIAFDERLDEGVVARLASMSPRQMRQALEIAHAKAACQGRRRVQLADLPDLREPRRRAVGFISSN